MVKAYQIWGCCLACFFSCLAANKEKINYIKSKYEHTLFGKQHLFYPAKNPKLLLIFFYGALKNRYLMWSQFWNDEEHWENSAHLFLKDDDTTWYLGNDAQDFVPNYSNIINHYIAVCKLAPDHVFTIGCSMGGYAAILYAILLGLKGVIAFNPQVNKASSMLGHFDGTGKRWRNLDEVAYAASSLPNLSLVYCHAPHDEAAGNALIDEFRKKTSPIIIRRRYSDSHTEVFGKISKEFIEAEIRYLENPPQIAEAKPTEENKNNFTHESSDEDLFEPDEIGSL
ncbi:MAG: hypothetical protein WCW33_00125 [Candidatus Babeliales bacterium]